MHLGFNNEAKSQKTILVHMKMTGHLLYGKYHFNKYAKKDLWEPIEPESLKDPFNRHVHFVISFSNKKFLALSDTRKFAKVTLIENKSHLDSDHLNKIGPEPLDKSFTFDKFVPRLKLKPNGKIKQVLMDQTIIAGIGNIYADESLWHAGIHPTRKVISIKNHELKSLFLAIKNTLSRSIDFGGDSMSDYRNIHGRKGGFQETHHAYKKTGSKCDKKGCRGKIVRMVVGARGTHYCNKHQI
jgi:formamidopyrimidine-DNA glycosylase